MKFAKTFHLPWSPGVSSDDKVHSLAHMADVFLGRILVITEKVDGENQEWTRLKWHLRSEDSTRAGALRSRSKACWAATKHLLDWERHYFIEDTSIEHSLAYTINTQPFHLITFYDKISETWAYWEELLAASIAINLQPVPLLSRRVFNSLEDLEAVTRHLAAQPSVFGGEREGIVVRVDEPLPEWTPYSAKFVRANHVRTGDDWGKGKTAP